MNMVFSDFSELEGSNCYCSDECAAEIRRRIAGLPLRAIHLIGTGDYHYQTLFWLERIEVPFALLLLDNHPDDQPGAFGDSLLSCGSWVAAARRLPLLEYFRWVRRAEDYRPEELPAGLPVYISLDLDLLSEDFARTDWDQGDMSLGELLAILSELKASGAELAGMDICGGISEEKSGSLADMELNRSTTEAVAALFRDC